MQIVSENASPTYCKVLYDRSQAVIPGGVNSPVRAFKAVGGIPRFLQSAQGSHVTDVEGRQYIDYVGSWGPMILGHNHPDVLEAVINAARQGLSFGAPCELEIKLAELICARLPVIEKIRMVNSGTEATMSAIRLARGFTGRNKIIKFEGCYHGHADSLLVKAGSGALTFNQPSSLGIPGDFTAHTLVATFNDLNSVTALFEQYGQDIAAIIIEPIPANMNLLLPNIHFLTGLRQLCDTYSSLLIFDEIISGFRVSPTGALGLYPIKPDLITLGKIIGGGMPVGAFGGRADIMDCLAPEGGVYQAGTLSGNPVAMAAGLATLQHLQHPENYHQLEQTTQYLVSGLLQRAQAAKIPLAANYQCGLFGLFFTKENPVQYYTQVLACNAQQFNYFFHAMLAAGIYLAPSMYEAGFVSFAHTAEDIERTLDAAEMVLQQMASRFY